MPLSSATFNTAISMSVPDIVGNLLNNSRTFTFGSPVVFANGSGAAQAVQVYANTRTVSTGTPDSIDVVSLTQPDGASFVATDIVAFAIRNRGTGAQVLTVGGGSNPVVSLFSTTLIVPPGATVVITNPAAAGFAINASTAHLIQVVAAAGTNVPYDLILLSH